MQNSTTEYKTMKQKTRLQFKNHKPAESKVLQMGNRNKRKNNNKPRSKTTTATKLRCKQTKLGNTTSKPTTQH